MKHTTQGTRMVSGTMYSNFFLFHLPLAGKHPHPDPWEAQVACSNNTTSPWVGIFSSTQEQNPKVVLLLSHFKLQKPPDYNTLPRCSLVLKCPCCSLLPSPNDLQSCLVRFPATEQEKGHVGYA